MPPEMVLTELERAELAEKVKELHKRGYRDVAEHHGLKVGARIRHHGHQWSEAFRLGTGHVAVLTEKPNSAWSISWHMPDIELIAVWDKPRGLGSSRLSQVAQYHVEVIELADASCAVCPADCQICSDTPDCDCPTHGGDHG